MRRGFKKEAHELGDEVRQEIGLSAHDPLDPWLLAEHLLIPVWPLTAYQADIPDAIALLAGAEQRAFSAMMAFVGNRRVIIYNDSHTLARQRADIAHELAHALLLHEPHLIVQGEPPMFDVGQEEEASWLGGVLLVPDEACFNSCWRGLSLEDAARGMGVSEDLMRWRLNKTGAQQRVIRARRTARMRA
jgi:Zn-dependent peptidase ImmA (M78 family)